MFHNTDNLTDKNALDWIAEILRKDETDNEDWEMIMRIIEWTGRDISPLKNTGDEGE